ncbi:MULTISPECIES: muramoyltetrapeptide carboxypeptidase [unclassified Rhodanobacter]|uniref:muramoyltetrapeptide carboxypeptidase n=1 Tax=unclassified Rhodanobacter TaxID=2621553 RepID=UPI001BDE16D2|nr:MULTISPECIES: muramoyltetrapeptide carboxypeptidase [unclassified Rhodanobacter]MBT2143413.1 muramoyltetrapeptide carboxypeptidase [Rhodanobacter sp. LX-99]MBT2147513.1 muramoyltetrapeptide carboxypeptidase [Rhodanobacter sp. LX-100]
MSDTAIRLIAPSGYPHDRAAMARGVARLREAGCELEGLEVLDRSEQRYAGSDAERAADLNALAMRDELPDIALAIRGGYGATRLLTQLHYDALRERLDGSGTVLVGHSDFTALQLALHAKSGLCTFSGPMLGADFGAETLSEFTWRHFWDTVRAPSAQVEWTTTPGLELDVEGPLWGGNLAVLCSLIGTPYFPAIEGGILFVEDVGEPPFRIERMLYQLHLSGVLGRQRALLLGNFSQCRPSGYDNGYGLVDSFAQIRRASAMPVIDGLPTGHEPDKFTLPFGAPARLKVAGGTAQLSFSDYPHLPPQP